MKQNLAVKGRSPWPSVVFSNQASESKASGRGRIGNRAHPLEQWQHVAHHPFLRQGPLPCPSPAPSVPASSSRRSPGRALNFGALSWGPGLSFHGHALLLPVGSQVSIPVIPEGGETCPDPDYMMCVHLFPIKQL